MKFAIILIGCLSLVNCLVSTVKQGDHEDVLAEGFRWGRQWDSSRPYECQYVSELRMMSCFRGLVECETVPRFEDVSKSYEIFAVGSSDLVNFFLYPRNFSDLVYSDARLTTPVGQVELRLFSSELQSLPNVRGFMVKDVRCYKKIIDTIRVINNPVFIDLSNGQKVSVLSYIVNLDGGLDEHPVHVSGQDKVVPFGKSLEVMEMRKSYESRWRLEDSTRRYECKYFPESEMLSCFRGLVKCETESRLDQVKNSYEIFGLGTTDLISYKLYPRNYTDVAYLSYRVPALGGRTVELSLLRSGFEGQGLWVKDAVCYQKIVDMLKVVSEPVVVDVSGEKVQMMGYIVNMSLKTPLVF